MAFKKDDLVARIAVEKGWATEAQVEDCRKAQADLPVDPEMTIGRVRIKPLGSVLLERQVITADQLDELVAEQVRRTRTMEAYEKLVTSEMGLGQELVRRSKATQLQVNKCLEIQRKFAEKGADPVPRLQQLLVQQGFVDEATVAAVAKALEAVVLACTDCGRQFNVVGTETGKTYKCRFCGGIMVTPGMRGSVPPGGAPPK